MNYLFKSIIMETIDGIILGSILAGFGLALGLTLLLCDYIMNGKNRR
tara:strand:+ start:533 stop:673 length:141 start_codon:yes stop_codon:yes gene_type:complete